MTYSRETAERLIAEAVEDDERMTAGPWKSSAAPSNTGFVGVYGEAGFPVASTSATWNRDKALELSDAAAIARTRNNLRALAEQLRAAVERIAELERERDRLREALLFELPA